MTFAIPQEQRGPGARIVLVAIPALVAGGIKANDNGCGEVESLDAADFAAKGRRSE